jgi:hypothetical protein
MDQSKGGTTQNMYNREVNLLKYYFETHLIYK